MRYVWLGFHILMLGLLVWTVMDGMSPQRGGSLAQNNSFGFGAIGIIVIWIIGAIAFRIARRFSKY